MNSVGVQPSKCVADFLGVTGAVTKRAAYYRVVGFSFVIDFNAFLLEVITITASVAALIAVTSSI